MNLNELFAEAADKMQTPAKTKPEGPADVGLSTTKMLKTEKEFQQYIDVAIMTYMDYHPTDVPRFSKTLKAYLTYVGIMNEKTFTMFDEFPKPPAILR